MNNINKILKEIKKERKRQDDIWGIQNHGPMEWLPILMEEIGEASKHALEKYYRADVHGYKKYRKELIQVASVAIAMIESYDRNEKKEEEEN